MRAQWAAQPFAWHIYPQADDAHRVKLRRVPRPLPARMAPAIRGRRPTRDSVAAWNGGADIAVGAAWRAARDARPAARCAHAQRGASISPTAGPGRAASCEFVRRSAIISGFSEFDPIATPSPSTLREARPTCRSRHENRAGNPRRQRDHDRARTRWSCRRRNSTSPAATRRSSR